MLAPVRAFALVVLMLWQSLGMSAPLAVEQRAEELQHVLLHGAAPDHGHAADPSLAGADGASLLPHFHLDHSASSPALPMSVASCVWHGQAAEPAGPGMPGYVPPALDQPLRPPLQA